MEAESTFAGSAEVLFVILLGRMYLQQSSSAFFLIN